MITPIGILGALWRQLTAWLRSLAVYLVPPRRVERRRTTPTERAQLRHLLSGRWACGWLDGVACLRVGSWWLCSTRDHLYRAAVVLGLLGLMWCGADVEEEAVRRPRAEEVRHV